MTLRDRSLRPRANSGRHTGSCTQGGRRDESHSVLSRRRDNGPTRRRKDRAMADNQEQEGGEIEVAVPDVLQIMWSARANEGIDTLRAGGYTDANLVALRNSVRGWVQGTYLNWAINVPQRRSFHSRMNHQENVLAHRTAGVG